MESLIECLVKVQDVAGEHGPGGQFRSAQLRIGLRFPHRDVIAKQMKAAGRATAARAGLNCTYAEGFRRERFGGIDSLAKDQQLTEDL